MHYENVLQPSLHGHFIIEVNVSCGQFIHVLNMHDFYHILLNRNILKLHKQFCKRILCKV